MRKRFFTLVMVALLAVVLCAWTEAQAGEYFKMSYGRFSAIAGATLATGDVVCISGSDGYAYKADANDSDKRPAVGIIGKGGATAARVEIIFLGQLAGQTAASPGARLFLSETAGAFTTTGPTNAQALGWVLPGETAGGSSSTDYFISVTAPSSAGAGY